MATPTDNNILSSKPEIVGKTYVDSDGNKYISTETGWDKLEVATKTVDANSQTILVKYLTGTLDNDAQTVFAHGLPAGFVLVGATFLIATAADPTNFFVNDAYQAQATYNCVLFVDNTNCTIDNGSAWNAGKYRIKLEYYV